jgi:hypothetical protein
MKHAGMPGDLHVFRPRLGHFAAIRQTAVLLDARRSKGSKHGSHQGHSSPPRVRRTVLQQWHAREGGPFATRAAAGQRATVLAPHSPCSSHAAAARQRAAALAPRPHLSSASVALCQHSGRSCSSAFCAQPHARGSCFDGLARSTCRLTGVRQAGHITSAGLPGDSGGQ